MRRVPNAVNARSRSESGCRPEGNGVARGILATYLDADKESHSSRGALQQAVLLCFEKLDGFPLIRYRPRDAA